jgi:hypothetical protein
MVNTIPVEALPPNTNAHKRYVKAYQYHEVQPFASPEIKAPVKTSTKLITDQDDKFSMMIEASRYIIKFILLEVV